MKINIPPKVISLLWDAKLADISLSKHKQYVIERVLEYGDLAEDKWLKSVYSIEDIIDVIKRSRQISIKTANYYSLIFNIPQEEILCFKQPFTQKQNRF